MGCFFDVTFVLSFSSSMCSYMLFFVIFYNMITMRNTANVWTTTRTIVQIFLCPLKSIILRQIPNQSIVTINSNTVDNQTQFFCQHSFYLQKRKKKIIIKGTQQFVLLFRLITLSSKWICNSRIFIMIFSFQM